MKRLFIEIFQPMPFACGLWLIVDAIKSQTEQMTVNCFFSLYFGFALLLSGIGLFVARQKEQSK